MAFSFLLTASAATSIAEEKKVDFAREIKPLLAGRCFKCHGPDDKARKAKLRLDLRHVAIKEAIVPGDAAKSELISRITSDDPDERMPPEKSKRPRLSAGEVDLIRRWIDGMTSCED